MSLRRPRYAVITWVDPVKTCTDDFIQFRGNRWYLLDNLPHDDSLGRPVFRVKAIKRQAFVEGELLVLDVNEREIGGLMRKPAKWGAEERMKGARRTGMTFALFGNLEQAVERVRRLFGGEGRLNDQR